ncbi:MAG: hypothetical protein ACLP9L_17805 [Thermoguttaceae bacterium]
MVAIQSDSAAGAACQPVPLGRLDGGATVEAIPVKGGGWGLQIAGAGMASAIQDKPVQLEFWGDAGRAAFAATSYDDWSEMNGGFRGKATLDGPGGCRFDVEDHWRLEGSVLRMARTVSVVRHASGGFLSGFTFDFTKATAWQEADWFAPGMIYGGFAHLSDAAIGGRRYYLPGAFAVHIREDRLPAPLFAAHFSDGTSLAVLNPAPRGDTTVADAHDTKAVPMIDGRFQFGAIGAEEHAGKLSLGYWFPGSEGEVTYAGNTYPGGQMHQWRRRYHPVQDGLVDCYEIAFRFGRNESHAACCKGVWRWAWDRLKPQLTPQDVAAARRSLVDVLAYCVVEKGGRSGIPNYVDAVSKDLARADRKAVMGFTGKNLEAADYLLQEAALDESPRGKQLRRSGEAIVASFLRLNMSPPVAEGFNLDDGRPVCAIGGSEVFLRSFGDDIKALLKAYERERRLGRDHPDWLKWCRQFADWLLTKQQSAGGFPRSWTPGNGQVVSASPNASFNAVPLLVILHRITGQAKYLEAARRAADLCWANGQCRGCFVGGTIDNPDIIDKEAGTLSVEAYLALYESTKEKTWLDRAAAAANFAETWIYCWNVPMPTDEDDSRLHWKRGVPTVGLQLVATGHSLVDAYMAFDADEFAKLYQYTGDPHYLAVARILLHNTKNMLAMPGRLFDLGTPGWQQEHWSLAPQRGYGLHRGWLPWVATSHLNGIFGVMELSPGLKEQLLNPNLEVHHDP